MKLNLSSNVFQNNKALNGGGLFLKDDLLEYSFDNTYSENNMIIVENNNFTENIAINEGGAIYLDYSKFYLAQPKNNKIAFNKAGIMGGGIYSLYSDDKKNIFSEENFNMINNTVESNISNIESKPSYIALDSNKYFYNITSGEYIPLTFTMYDQFNNTLKDYSEYYSSITLKVKLQKEKEENNNFDYDYDTLKENIDYKLSGNIGSFINGDIKIIIFLFI